MSAQMQDFVAEQTAVLQDQVEKIRKESVETVREAVVGSAENLKALKSPVRTIARSTVKGPGRGPAASCLTGEQ